MFPSTRLAAFFALIIALPPAYFAAPLHDDLDETVVHAWLWERDPLENPAAEIIGLQTATSEVISEDILRQNPRTLTEALNFAPGAWTETRGRKVKQFTSFRGQTYPYPDYAIDGMWFREFYELPYFFPPSEIERIKVVRSSAALMTGLSGLSGVINIIPKVEDERVTRLEGEYGTDNYQRYYLSHSEPIEGGSILFSAGHQTTDGPDGLHAAERMTTGSIRLHWSPTPQIDWDSFLFILNGDRQLEFARPPASPGVQRRVEEFDPIRSILFGTRARFHHGELSTTEVSLWGADRQARFRDYQLGTFHDDDDYEYGVQVLHSLVPCENNILRFGALYHRWAAPGGKRFYSGKRTDIETVSAVIVDQHDFGKLKLDAGYRYTHEYYNDFAAYNIEGSPAGLGNANPIMDEWAEPQHRFNIGGKYELCPDTSLYANYSFGQVDAPPGAVSAPGNTLDRESRHMVDAGILINTTSIGVLKAGLFGVQRNDGINITGTGPVAPFPPVYANQDSRQYGFEAEWRSPWYWDRLSFFGSVQWMQAQMKNAAGSYTRDLELPRSICTAGVYFREGNFDASLFAKHVSAYQNNRFSNTGPKPLGDYIDLNFTAGYTFESPVETRVFVALNNLLDDNYSSVVGYYDHGFRLTAGLQCAF
jgi:outer membrane receptor protein involved in Fe transport